ncbi:MAG: hypothetical protein ACRENE_23155 [Polyangiaceae bacterium]
MSFVGDVVTRVGRQSVRVRHDTALSQRLQNAFPFALGRIDWRGVRGTRTLWAPAERALGANSPDVPFQTLKYVPVVVAFFDEAIAAQRIDDAWVAFCSDSVEEEFEIERERLAEILALSSEIPDHKYVFSLEGRWCLMWSMEHDLYFGVAPPVPPGS